MKEHTYVRLERFEGCSYCGVCEGFEGSLTTECPGEKVTARVSERVYAGALDFVDGRWVQHEVRGLVIRMPHEYHYGAWRWDGRREGHELEMDSIPLSAVERWSYSNPLVRVPAEESEPLRRGS